MAIHGVNIDATDEYICKEDKVEPTRWVLGTLSSRVMGVLLDQSAAFTTDPANTDEVKAEFKGSQAAYRVVQFALKGWVNFLTPEGQPIEFETVDMYVPSTGIQLPGIPDALMEVIPLPVIRELHEEIDRRNTPSSKEGNSSGK